jgi:YbbR domain-containing protein
MMERLFKNNTIVKVVAFFMASMLWVYVTSDALRATIPDISTQFRNVPLAWLNLGDDLAMMRIPGEIDIVLSGRRDLINDTSLEDINLFVNLEGLGEGQHRISPSAEVPRGVRVVSYIPQQVVVDLEKVASPELPVSLEIVGAPATGFVVGEPRVIPESVTATGPRSALARVHKVRAIISVDGANADQVHMVPVVAVDANGQEVENVVLSPGMVEVLVPLSEPQVTRPVNVPLEGEPAEGYRIRQVNIDPATVTILGPEELIQAIENVTTSPVNINNASETITFTVSLDSPGDEVRVDYEGQVTVEIIIEPE